MRTSRHVRCFSPFCVFTTQHPELELFLMTSGIVGLEQKKNGL